MEFRELVEQIAAKVAERIAEMEKKPKLLILSEAHAAECHALWENESLNQKYDIVCALMNEYQCDVRQFDVIVLRTLSNKALGKIAEGFGDCSFTEMAIKAVLLGKQILAFHEETELFQYRETAPKPYYDMMLQKVELLKNSGIRFCGKDQIIDILLERESRQAACEIGSGKSVNFDKRIITERDIQGIQERNIKQICIKQKTIVTDLAREYAERRGISFSVG